MSKALAYFLKHYESTLKSGVRSTMVKSKSKVHLKHKMKVCVISIDNDGFESSGLFIQVNQNASMIDEKKRFFEGTK